MSHVDPKVEIKVDSDHLDFSFTKLEDVESLRMKEPRAGKRKPIEEILDEDEEKKAQQETLNDE